MTMIHVSTTARAALFATAAWLAQAAAAAPIGFEATMHVSPDASSEVVGTLPAGSSISPLLRDELAAAGIAEPPPGWVAVRHSATLEGFVRSRDIGKDFSMKPDSPFFAEADEGSSVLAMVGPKDLVETGDPAGRFSQATLRQDKVVFVNTLPPGSRAARGATPPPAQSTRSPDIIAQPSTPAPPPTPATAPQERQPDSPPPAINAAPRTFEGYLMRTRRILGRGPKLDYQLVDEDNKRIALLDMSALLVTEPIEFFEGRLVRIYGPGMAMEGVSDAIIRVENLRLAR